MTLKRIILTNFKNYPQQQFDLSEGLNCFVGPNGSGKTNLLDAVYYLCMCKSYFSMPDAAIIRKGQDFFRIEGHFDQPSGKSKVVAKYQKRKKKVMERNGVPYQKLAGHIGLIPVVMIAPDDTALAREGSEERRKFLDNTLCQLDPVYLDHLMRYNKVLSQRNAALKQFGKTGIINHKLIDTYDQQMLEPAGFIHRKRQAFILQLQPVFYKHYAIISSEKETVKCRYKSPLSDQPFEDLLARAREKDILLQRSTTGIQKDDLIFLIEDDAVKRFGSQGQLKSFVLSMKLAQFDLIKEGCGKTPLLLLDDIFDKLDGSRVEQLLSLLLNGNFEQVFLTDTHEERIKEMVAGNEKDHFVFRVQNGSAETI